ncbi:two-component regulator propeller domain-containing protein [Formosa sp. PL04]|uniref:hybrid sensor histidine kinase/response regulator transcription factor n=1 Tax=Formosa sp. PL04 TaxID=3081755 RepID=UPI002981641F|nr:two-component regulator propeller domain-containing protein [Formosa sp. PL04]MDW5287240.1 two-component regulator propeller domain-containing protein [Formosa sp. PL04]
MKKNLIYFVLFYFVLIAQIWSQNHTDKLKFVSIKEGISKVGIFTITQDSSGFIWLGTNGSGLYRFNGLEYDLYKHVLNDSTSISSSLVYSSFLDEKDRLWFGTEEGLNIYDKDNNQFKRIPIIDANSDSTNYSIRSLTGDKKGNIFIGTYDHGLFKIDINTLQVRKIAVRGFNTSEIININALEIDNNNKLYVGTNLGLAEYNESDNTISPLIFEVDIDNNITPKVIDQAVKSILFDKKNDIWVGTTSDGLIHINRSLKTSFEFSKIDITDNIIFSIIQLSDGTIMCGTENDGLFHIASNGNILNNYKASKSDNENLLSNSIWSLYLDKNERIWMGYYNAGVSVFDKLYDKFSHIKSIKNTPNSLKIPSVTSITETNNGNLWICMDGGGIDIYNNTSNSFTHINKLNNEVYKGLTSDYIENIFVDSHENIWVGSWDKGLYFLKKGTNEFINYNVENSNNQLTSNTVMSIAEDSNGIIWLGTYYKGLHAFNPVTKKFTHYNSKTFIDNQLTTTNIGKVLVDDKDNIWVGSTRGLFKIEQNLHNNKMNVISYSARMSKDYNNHTSTNHILTLLIDVSKNLWIGTRGAGLCKYNISEDNFTWFNEFNGLIEDNVCSIVESLDGDIWLAGNTGITEFNLATSNFTNYTTHDGLLSNDYNVNSSFRDKAGNLYFGNFQGIDYINPSKIETNKNLPFLYLSGFKLANKDVVPKLDNSPLSKVISETESITLNSSQSVFTIEYSTINFTRPEENEFAYYLEGYENDWNYVGKNKSAIYTNLDPGEYTFKVKSSNNDGIWNETSRDLKITILPPWWKSTFAVFAYILLFLLAIYLLNKVTNNRLKEKQEIQSERNLRLQEKELNEKKFQFFTNISHEFRTPLTLILSPLKDILSDETLKLPERINNKHRVIYKNTDRLYRLVNELLDFRKLELDKMHVRAQELNLLNFSNQILSHFKEEALNRNIQLSIDADIRDLTVWADESMLEKIIFNLLSNAIKLTPDGGFISMNIYLNETTNILPLIDSNKSVKTVEIDVSDSGPGLEKDQINKIFERFYQVDHMNKTYYGSTGIGLEVVQNFVFLHKGKIEVESVKGEGTTFKIILPAGNSHFKAEELSIEKEQIVSKKDQFTLTNLLNSEHTSDEIKTEILSNYTLLVVEDNIELRNYLKNELALTYKVIVAKNGKEGYQMAQEHLPDIILTDVIMPEMDGLALCQMIKKDLKTSHIPLLMLTAKAQIDDRIESIQFGADAYMIKPFDMRLLKLRLSQLITSRQLIFNKYFSVISDASANVNMSSLDKKFLDKVLNYINNNISNQDLNVELLASELNLSRSQFYRKIKALTNQTANEFLRNIRLQKAKQIMENGNSNIGEVCYLVGFSSASYFTKCFKSNFGMLPTELKIKKNTSK